VLRLLRKISVRQLRSSWGRTALVVGGAATGVTLIVAINVINTSILANFRAIIDRVAGPAQLEVTLGVGEIGFQESTIEEIRDDPDVAVAVPLVRGTVSLADAPSETLQLFGADLTTEDQLNRYEIAVTSGRRKVAEVLTDPHAMLITDTFARRRGVAVDDTLSVATPHGIEPVQIRGILSTRGVAEALGEQLVVMDLTAAQRLLLKEGRVDQIDVVVRPNADVGAVQERLQRALPALTVGRPMQRSEQYDRILASFQAMLTGLSLLCLVAGVFIIYNTASTGVLHRAVVMASLRQIGASAGQLFALLVLEAAVLGVVGAAIGIPIGIGLALLLGGNVADAMGVIFQLHFPMQMLAVDVRHQALIGMTGVVMTVLASSLAAWRVAVMDPLDIMRSDVGSIGFRVPVRRLVAWWVVLVAVSAAALAIEIRFKSIMWGNFGSTVWNSSVLVIAIPIVTWLAGLLTRWLPRVFRAEGRMAAASLFRSPGRTGVTAAAVALVLTIAITVASLSLSHQRSVDTYFSGGFLASDLMVSAVATDGGWLETPIPETLGAEVAKVPGVRSVESFRVLPGQMFRGARITVAGGSEGFFDIDRFPSGWYREGDAHTAGVAIQRGDGASISTSLSDRFDLHVGDRIALDTPTGPLNLPIVGVVPDYMSDRGSVILNRRLLVERWHEAAINRIHVFLEPGATVETVRAGIAARLGENYRLKILSLGELRRYHAVQVKRAFALTDAIQLLVVIVTIAGIFDLLISSIIERRRDLALWRVMGADERAVRRSVVLESATIGALGAILGVAVGFVTAWIWVGINFRYLLGYYLEYHFALGATTWYVALVILMTVLAGYLAAVQATRQSILEAIRKE
jgi:putative ABC transport system permease protein